MDKEIERHIASNGEDWTPAGQMVEDLATGTDFHRALTNPLIANSSIKEKLASMTVSTSDPQVIRALVRADRGDRDAIFWLLQKAPHKVWQMSDMTPKFAQEIIDRGHLAYGPERVPMLQRVFDSAIEEEQFFVNARNAFLAADRSGPTAGLWSATTRTNVTMPYGTVGVPGLRRIGDVAGKAQRKAAQVSTDIARGEAGAGLEQWATTYLGKVGGAVPVTRLLQWAGGRKPTGMVSLSRTRPGDSIMELQSFLDSLWWTRGNRTFDVMRDGERRTVSGAEYRTEVSARIGTAVGNDDLARVAAEVKAIEEELTSSVFLRYEGLDNERVTAIVKGWQDARDIDVSRIQRDGFFFDEQGSRVLVDPLFQRQLADNMRLLDLADLDKSVRRAAGGPSGRLTAATQSAEAFLDSIQKAWRTETLFKPGYTVKNSIVEPWVSSLLAHGTIASPDGILATTANVLANTRNRIMSSTYAVADATGKVVQRVPGLRRALGDSYIPVSKDIERANVQRIELESELSKLEAELDHAADGERSPAWRREFEPQIQLRMAEVRSSLDGTYESLDRLDPMWRNDPRYPTYRDMRDEVALLDTVLTMPPGEAATYLGDRIAAVHAAAAESGVEAVTTWAGRMDRNRAMLRSSISGDQSMVESIPDDLWGGYTGQAKYISLNEEVTLENYIFGTAQAADVRMAQIEAAARAGQNTEDLTAELWWLDRQLDEAVAYRNDPTGRRADFLASLEEEVPVFHAAPLYSQDAQANLALLESLAEGIERVRTPVTVAAMAEAAAPTKAPEPISVREVEPGVMASEDGRWSFRQNEDGEWAAYDSTAATAVEEAPAELDRWLPVGMPGAAEPDVWLADDWSIQRLDDGDFGVYPPYASEPVARADTLDAAKAHAVEQGGPEPLGAPGEPPRPAGEWEELAASTGEPQYHSNNWTIQDNGEEFTDNRFTIYRPFEDDAWDVAPTLSEAKAKARGPVEETSGTRSPVAPVEEIKAPTTVGERWGMGDMPRGAPDVRELTWKRTKAGEYVAQGEDGPSSWTVRKEDGGWVLRDSGTPVGEPFRILRDAQEALATQRHRAPRRRSREELETLADSEFDWSPASPGEWRLGEITMLRDGDGWAVREGSGLGVEQQSMFPTMGEAADYAEQRFVVSGGEPGITPGVEYTRAMGQQRQVEGAHNVSVEDPAVLDSPVDVGPAEGLPTDGLVGTYASLDEARAAVTVPDMVEAPSVAPIDEAISGNYAAARAKLEEAKAALRETRAAYNSPVKDVSVRKAELERSLADVNQTLSARTQRLAALEAKRDKYRQRALGGTRAIVWRQNGERVERLNYLDRRKSREYERQWRANKQAEAEGRPGDVVPLPENIKITEGLFDESAFGEAIRAEFGAQATARATIDPARTGAYTADRFARSGGTRQISRDDPDYWSELAYIVNRQIRQDLVGQQALQGADPAALAALLRTPAGKRYLEQMGWLDESGGDMVPSLRAAKARTPEEVKAGQQYLDMEDITYADGVESIPMEMRRLIDQYLPRAAILDPDMIAAYKRQGYALPDNATVQHLAAAKEVTPNELRLVMSGQEHLSPILAGQLEFLASNQIRRKTNEVLDKVWDLLAARPEERVARFPGGQRFFEQAMAEDMEFIRQQGGTLNPSQINALRQAASARALNEVEKTYYNIRRYSNPVYALRYIMGFPGAYFNSIYRMARLTLRKPGNAVVLANSYQGGLGAFAVDAEGNPVDRGNWQNAEGIVVNLPGPLKNIYPEGDKITVSTRSWDFVTQAPSFSWAVGIPIQSFMAAYPDLNQTLKEVLSPATYKALFPFGPIQKNDWTVGPVVLDPLVSGYVKDALTSFNDDGDDFIQATTQYLQFLTAEWEKNGKDPNNKPTIEQAQKMAADHWRMRAITKWSMAGGYKIDPAGQLMRDEWYKIQQKHPGDPAAARDEMLRKHGESAVWYTTSSSNYRARVYPSVDGYKRLKENEGLVKNLFQIDPTDPDVVGLVAIDSTDVYDPAVRTWMGDYTIPGDSSPLRTKLTPQEWLARTQAGQSWEVYNAEKAKRDAMMVKYGVKSLESKAAAPLKAAWDAWLADFEADPENANWLVESQKRDFSRAGKTVRGLEMILKDEKFVKDHGQSSFWMTARRYVSDRRDAVMLMGQADTSEERKIIKDGWSAYVRKEFLPSDKTFAGLYSRNLDEYDLGK